MTMPSKIMAFFNDCSEEIDEMDLEVEISVPTESRISHGDETSIIEKEMAGRKGNRSVPCQGAKSFSIGAIRFE